MCLLRGIFIVQQMSTQTPAACEQYTAIITISYGIVAANWWLSQQMLPSNDF